MKRRSNKLRLVSNKAGRRQLTSDEYTFEKEKKKKEGHCAAAREGGRELERPLPVEGFRGVGPRGLESLRLRLRFERPAWRRPARKVSHPPDFEIQLRYIRILSRNKL